MDSFITLAHRINHTRYNLSYPTLSQVTGMIRDGNMVLCDSQYGKYTLAQAIEHIRKQPENEMQYWKARLLPAVAYNGTFSETDSTHLISYSNVTAMDFDHIGTQDEMTDLRNWLIRTPCVLCVFVTPGGRGLKALILHDNTDPDRHRDLYTQLLDKFNVAGKDSACKDMARRNYLSYDPDIWMNPNPVTFHYIPTVRAQGKVIQPHAERKVSDKSIINIINSLWKKNNPEYWKEGNRAESIFKLACLMCKWGVDESLAIGYFTEGWKSPTMSEEEILGHVRNAYRAEKNNFGTLEFNVY